MEADRLYCDNKGKSLSWDENEPSERELRATFFDFCNLGGKHLLSDQRQSALIILRDEYVKYVTRALQFKNEKAMSER